MRCPKCGYISFDTLGNCKKCNKEIGALLEELEGTVYEAAAPSFLHIRTADALPDAVEPETEDGLELFGDTLQEEELSMPDTSTSENVLTEDMDLEEDVAVDFDEMEEVEISSEILFEETVLEDSDTFSTEAEEKKGELELDFGDIDISDLAPPEPEEKIGMGGETNESTVAASEPSQVEPAPVTVADVAGLEDLQVEDLDLDAPAPLISGSKIGEKLMPSVKTGTALDEFDIDLGELISEKK